MSPALLWREATRDDRRLLQGFSCTSPPRKDLFRRGRYGPHPREWEAEVQAGIRALTPPIRDGCLLLGEDEAGLAAVALVYFFESGAVAKLTAVAVALRARGYGRHLGDEALEMALREIADNGHGAGHRVIRVFGLVHPKNEKSQALCRRAGLALMEPQEDGLQEWQIDLELPPEYMWGGLRSEP